jgi:hypothetical protein
MKKLYLITSLLCLYSASSLALLPPQYLSVPQWQSCVGKMTKGSAEFICLPAKKPDNCLGASWQSLLTLDEIDRCPVLKRNAHQSQQTAS